MAHGTQPQAAISIHVLRVEDNTGSGLVCARMRYFNPRPPCGGQPGVVFLIDEIQIISIHVLRVEDNAGTELAQYGL